MAIFSWFGLQTSRKWQNHCRKDYGRLVYFWLFSTSAAIIHSGKRKLPSTSILVFNFKPIAFFVVHHVLLFQVAYP